MSKMVFIKDSYWNLQNHPRPILFIRLRAHIWSKEMGNMSYVLGAPCTSGFSDTSCVEIFTGQTFELKLVVWLNKLWSSYLESYTIYLYFAAFFRLTAKLCFNYFAVLQNKFTFFSCILIFRFSLNFFFFFNGML